MRSLLIPVSLIAVWLAACGGDSDRDKSNTASPVTSPAAVADLARAVVQIQALDGSGDLIWAGSGTFISEDGLILTNAHVVDDRGHEYADLAVATTVETDQPPDLNYVAEIAAVDYALDLAVIRVASDLDGNEVTAEFPFVPLGDSETVEIGDNIRVLGYPGIGGDTITFTNGVISGFTSERSVGGRAWIKTDATITGGNSGGLAVDAAGRLIGVPTIVGSGVDEETVDCRYITDTNRDGNIDEADTCVPVGGFINGLRPVNLAAPLVDAAISGAEYVSPIETDVEPAGGFDTGEVFISNMVFADGVTEDDQPTEELDAMPTGVSEVCGFWDYEGMDDGMSWEALWFVDGELSEDGSIIGETWVGGEKGSWWACILDEQGLKDGLYELIISFEDEPQGSRAVFVGGDHPSVKFTLENSASTPVCYVYISPSGAQNWGFDYLDIDEAIAPDEKKKFDLPRGLYDLLVEDCDENGVVEEYEIEIMEDSAYTLLDD